MVRVPTRCTPKLAVTANVTVPLPVPLDAPLMLSPPPGKFAVTLAVHPQLALLAVMATGYESAFFGTVCPVGGLRVKLHPSACVTVNVWPATVSVPVRRGPVLAATVKFTAPLPVPVAGVTPVIQGALLAAVHEHPDVAATAIAVPAPPAAATDWDVGLMEYAHAVPC